MNLNIDKNGKEPVYEQIRRQIEELVRDGLLEGGQKVPSVRQLARSLGVSVKTVHTAYEELAAQNIIETRHGSGTYIIDHPEIATGANLRTREEMEGTLKDLPKMRWEPYFFRSEFFGMPRSKRHYDKLIKFTAANPDPALFPFDRIKQVATNMLWYPKEFFFDYGNPQGHQPLVEYLEKEMALSGIPMAEGENDIILTGGFQRALALVLDLILKPGQKVAIEAPAFTGLLNLLIAKQIEFIPIPVDDQGMDTDLLGAAIKKEDIHAIITIPTYHNPTGITMSRARREHLIRLSAKHRIPIIEDDWGRYLSYEGEVPAPLKAMDPGDYVIHIGTFSKCFLPGMRIGWITSPAPLSIPLVMAKAGSDVGDSYFLQALLHEFILKGHFSKHLRKVTKTYKKRCNAMCRSLDRFLPDGCSYTAPKGGLSIWVDLPKNIKSLPMLSLAREAGVEYLPSSFCMPDRKDSSALRLSFARHEPEEIEVGIRALCSVIADCIDDPGIIERGAKEFEDLFR